MPLLWIWISLQVYKCQSSPWILLIKHPGFPVTRSHSESDSETLRYMSVTAVFFFFKLLLFIYLFIYLWLCWVFVSVRGLSLVVASRDHSSSRCAGLSLSWPLLLRGTGSRHAGSVVVAHRPSCSAACGIFPDQGSNPCPLHCQADSQPPRHQGSPNSCVFKKLHKKFRYSLEFENL